MNAPNFVRTEKVNGALVATLTTTTLSEYESGLVIEHVQREAPAAKWNVVMDFAQIHFLSSPGISMIISLVHEARRGRGKFVICNLNEDIQEIFRMTRVEKTMMIEKTLEDAMKKMG